MLVKNGVVLILSSSFSVDKLRFLVSTMVLLLMLIVLATCKLTLKHHSLHWLNLRLMQIIHRILRAVHRVVETLLSHLLISMLAGVPMLGLVELVIRLAVRAVLCTFFENRRIGLLNAV